MRVLLVDVNYKNSSTGKIVHNLAEQLDLDGHQALVCYGRGEKTISSNAIRVSPIWETYFHALMTRITGLTGFFSFFATQRLIAKIKKFKPDVVNLHELHGYFANIGTVVRYLKDNNIPVVWTFHCEFMYTGKCGHAYDCNKWLIECNKCPQIKEYPASFYFDFTKLMFNQKKKLFDGFNNLKIITPSQWLAGRVQQSFLKDKNIEVIHNGIDTDNIFYPRETSNLINKYYLQNKKVILAVAPNIMSLSKGGKWIVSLSEMFNEDFVFILIGVENTEQAFPKNIIPLPRINDQDELAEYYSLADIFLICSKRENFPTTCLESLSCGTPVIGFDEGGTAETAPENYGFFVPYGDLNKLYEAINNFYNSELKLKTAEECRNFSEGNYSKKSMYLNYLDTYKKMSNSKES